MGANAHSFKSNSTFRVFTKANDLARVTSSQLFTVIDESELTLDDGSFATDPDNQLGQFSVVDLPASRHGRAGSLAFADGHSEGHRWLDGRTSNPFFDRQGPFPGGGFGGKEFLLSSNKDIAFVQQHSTVPPSGGW